MADKLTIWQQNVNKSPTCQHDLLSNSHLARKNINIIALQEPAINAFDLTIASRDWTPIYPSTHVIAPDRTRAITYVSTQVSSDTWNQIDFPSGDVAAIQITGPWGNLVVINVYNEGNSSKTVKLLTKFHREHRNASARGESGNTHIIWLGDFNRHHPHWDNPNDTRLFTREALREVEILIEALAEVGLKLALPSGIPTHVHNVTKRWSRLDHVFISEHSVDLVVSCDTQRNRRGINTDHLPILTELNLNASMRAADPIPNFREVDWVAFSEALERHLKELQPAAHITTQVQLDQCCDELTKVIQHTISVHVPSSDPSPKSKRWWTKELTQLRSHANKLGRLSFEKRNEPGHAIHMEHKAAAREYDKMLQSTKKQHWRNWLERADEPDIWAMHRLVSAPATDGGKARIPVLSFKEERRELLARTNDEKSITLAKGFFPPRPVVSRSLAGYEYLQECKAASAITAEQLRGQLHKLKPYKAPGPDGIPNIVLTKCANLLTDRLLHIYC